MLKVHGRVLLRHLERLLHVAKRRGENQLMTGSGKLLECALGGGRFRHVLKVSRFDPVPQCSHHLLTADVVLKGPTQVADGAEIDKPDFEFIRSASVESHRGNCKNRSY